MSEATAVQAQTVYILRYWHKHGDDITAYATQEAAEATVAEIVREWWADALRWRDDLPKTPDALTDTEAVRMYFEATAAQEGYEITEAPVID